MHVHFGIERSFHNRFGQLLENAALVQPVLWIFTVLEQFIKQFRSNRHHFVLTGQGLEY